MSREEELLEEATGLFEKVSLFVDNIGMLLDEQGYKKYSKKCIQCAHDIDGFVRKVEESE